MKGGHFGAGGGGGGANHNILSATHSDSLAGTVVRGDVIIGNLTPAWARLAIGAANTRFQSNGTDPAWVVTNIGCRVYNSVDIAVANNTTTVLTFDTERYDTDTMHSTASNTGRITFTTAGVYIVGGSMAWSVLWTGGFDIAIRLGGTTRLAHNAQHVEIGDIEARSTIITAWNFAAGEYVEFTARHNQGGSINVVAEGNTTPEFWAQKIDRAG